MSSQCANPLLLQWIKEWYDAARESGSKGASIYKKAYDSMKVCPLTFDHPSEAQQLHGLGSKLCDRLTEKLDAYCVENGLPMPQVSRTSHKRLSDDNAASGNSEPPGKKSRKAKPYVPSLRSGAYALILALSTLPEGQSIGLTKAQLIEQAQEHCDSSFTAPVDTTKFYTAWNSMKTLVDKDLVYEKGRPLRRYLLSDEGWEVAKRMQNVQGRQPGPKEVPFKPQIGLSGALSSGNQSKTGGPGSFTNDRRIPKQPRTATSGRQFSQEAEIPVGIRSGRRSEAMTVEHRKGLPVNQNRSLPFTTMPALDREYLEISSDPEPPSDPDIITGRPQIDRERERSGPERGMLSDVRGPGSLPGETQKMEAVPGFPKFTPIRLLPGTFTVQLVLDSREVRAKNDRDYIHDELAKRGVNALVRPLELGDFLWVAKCKEPALLGNLGEEGDEIALDWIIERKRLDDLIGSIKDGRFQEQKFRFRKLGVKNVVYIIEEFSVASEKISHFHEAIESAMGSMQVVDGYFVKKTSKLDDTIRYLARMTSMVKSLYESKPLHIIPSGQLQAKTYLPLLTHLRTTVPEISYNITYASFCAMASKTDSLTLRDVFLKMLMCTRGVTGDKALEIQNYWTTPRAFIEALEVCPEKKGREALLESTLGVQVGRRKLGKAVGAKVAEIWGEA